MKVEQIKIKSDKKNLCEDYLVVYNQSLFAVLDGATPTSSFQDDKGRNGATLASRTVGEALRSLADADSSIKELVSKANAQLLDAMTKSGIKSENKHETWNTCLAMVRINEEYIEYAQIGDCMIFAVNHLGEVETLSKDMVVGISKRAREERARIREMGFTIQSEEYYRVFKNSLEFNRYLANTDNGYAVLNGDKKADDYLCTGKIEKKNYSHVLLISDGLFPGNRDWAKMITNIKDIGLKKYVQNVVAYEEKHDILQDDKTAIFIDLLQC